MALKYKPDFLEAKKYWKVFWEGDVIDRPLIISTIPKNSENPVSMPPYLNGIDGDFEKAIHIFEEYAENTYFACEKIPSFQFAFGPDEVSYFLKSAEKNIVAKSNTAWIEPFVDDWKNFNILELDKDNEWYKKFINFYEYAAEKGDGKFLLVVDLADFHTHFDSIRAIRGSERLCMDLIFLYCQ